MCVICKQARRSGRAWSGMDGCWLPAGVGPPGRNAGPPVRCGKRAFVRAVPQLVANVRAARVCPSLSAQPQSMSYCQIHRITLTLWQDTGVQSRCSCSQFCTHCTGTSGADKLGPSISETCVLVQLPGPESGNEVGIIESYMCLYADVEAAAGQLLDASRI